MDLLVEIGNRIVEKRKQLGLTQEYLSEKMDVSVQMISNLERGNKSIRIENLIKLSKILGVSTDYILTGASTPKDNEKLMSKLDKLSKKDREMIEILIEFCASKRE